MAAELKHECPECETERSFYLAASTLVHLGEKYKWRCPECDYGIVRIGNEVDTAPA